MTQSSATATRTRKTLYHLCVFLRVNNRETAHALFSCSVHCLILLTETVPLSKYPNQRCLKGTCYEQLGEMTFCITGPHANTRTVRNYKNEQHTHFVCVTAMKQKKKLHGFWFTFYAVSRGNFWQLFFFCLSSLICFCWLFFFFLEMLVKHDS